MKKLYVGNLSYGAPMAPSVIIEIGMLIAVRSGAKADEWFDTWAVIISGNYSIPSSAAKISPVKPVQAESRSAETQVVSESCVDCKLR